MCFNYRIRRIYLVIFFVSLKYAYTSAEHLVRVVAPATFVFKVMVNYLLTAKYQTVGNCLLGFRCPTRATMKESVLWPVRCYCATVGIW